VGAYATRVINNLQVVSKVRKDRLLTRAAQLDSFRYRAATVREPVLTQAGRLSPIPCGIVSDNHATSQRGIDLPAWARWVFL